LVGRKQFARFEVLEWQDTVILSKGRVTDHMVLKVEASYSAILHLVSGMTEHHPTHHRVPAGSRPTNHMRVRRTTSGTSPHSLEGFD
jgi:hypothetical protein